MRTDMQSLHVARKLGVYRALYRLNKSFADILTQFGELQELKILNSETARRYCSLTQELQAEVNRGLANIIETVESRNHSRFIRTRMAGEEQSRSRRATR